MAEIKPIRAWRYNEEIAEDIDLLTSPLFDVVSERQRKSLYQNPLNSIHLSVPQPPDAANRARKLLSDWKRDGVITQDRLPGIYVYYQYFKLAGDTKAYCRKGFVCHIRTYPFEDEIILRHESTIPQSVNDRIELLEKTELHVSPTHGLYTDETFELERYMDEAITCPIYETEDYQGVRDVLAVIHDAKVIKKFISNIGNKTVILADGHHRYASSLMHLQKSAKANPAHTGREGYNFHLMYLTNTEAGDLKILPTHRLIANLKSFDPEKTKKRFTEDFIVRDVEDASTLNEIIVGKKWAFGIILKDSAFKVRLKPEVFHTMRWHFPEEIKALDLTVLHYFIIEKILGIPGKEQRASENISFDRSFADCLTRVVTEEVQMAIITQEVSIEDVKRVCHSGFTMPQKSTYFYPKVICGFLFSSIREEEFKLPEYSPF
jgi:uncharacterized protein (DUF1015 family)